MPKIVIASERDEMVRHQVEARGVRDQLVLKAMRKVPREMFVPENLREFAFDDNPLPIAEGQTISQPYIVAFMIEAMGLKGGEKVLEVGTGSGYAAAILSQIALDVYTVERLQTLADEAKYALQEADCFNVHVMHGDGTRGWPEHAPYDAIVVAAGGPQIPEALKQQLKIGGRLVIPVGTTRTNQELVRVTRLSETRFKTEEIADVRFVPLIGDEGWKVSVDAQEVTSSRKLPIRVSKEDPSLSKLIFEQCEPFDYIESADLGPLLDRIGDARVVLLGEATHGTSQFYEMRDQITRALIEKKGFSFVSIEGDWPDVARIDHYVRHFEYPASEWTAFSRFPTWMWRNREVRNFVDWLRYYNADFEQEERVAFYGLDLYSLYRSIGRVIEYLQDVDPETARIAKHRYGCLMPWQSDPAAYGQAALSGKYRSCEVAVAKMLNELRTREMAYTPRDGERYFDAMQNARLVVNAEEYYRIMYYGSRASWNLRDGHMFATLEALLEYHGNHSKAIVWAHNSHVGNAGATEMAYRRETNIGELCRNRFGDKCYSIGFGTHTGTVAAASEWGGPMEVKKVLPSLPQSYERLFYESECAKFMLPLRYARSSELRDKLLIPRLQRAIGVIYRPETERGSHYFECCLPRQFDEVIWFNESSAVSPIRTSELKGMPDTYPFGL